MPDVYTKVAEAAPEILEGLMTALELRAADPQQRAMLHTYLTDAALPQGARVLEVGCGTGAVTRLLATWPGVVETIGVDPSPVFVARARQLARELTTAVFEQADGRSLPFADSMFDAVVFHTTLCHVKPFANTSSTTLGWYGDFRRWSERSAWILSVCAAMATWKRPRRGSCCPAGSTWVRTRWWPPDGSGRTRPQS